MPRFVGAITLRIFTPFFVDPASVAGVRSSRRPTGRPYSQVEPMDSYPSRQAVTNTSFAIALQVNVRAQGAGGSPRA